jgi:hypothetical protein
MTSLEDRYGSIWLDVLIHTLWSREPDDPPLTASALGSSRHLAHIARVSCCFPCVRAGFLITWLLLDVCGFLLGQSPVGWSCPCCEGAPGAVIGNRPLIHDRTRRA